MSKVRVLIYAGVLTVLLPLRYAGAQVAEWSAYMEQGRVQESAGQFKLAEKQYFDAVSLAVATPALGVPRRFQSYESLAHVYQVSGRYDRAAATYELLLGMIARDGGTGIPTSVSMIQVRLAQTRAELGDLAAAETWCRNSLAIETATGKPSSDAYPAAIRQLAEIKRLQGKYAEAGSLLKEAQPVIEARFGAQHPIVASHLQSLADLYLDEGLYLKAEALYKSVLELAGKAESAGGPDAAAAFASLGQVYTLQSRFDEALTVLQQALALREKALGALHPKTAEVLVQLAGLHGVRKEFAKAGPLFAKAQQIQFNSFDDGHPAAADRLVTLAHCEALQGHFPVAEKELLDAMAIRKQRLGAGHPRVAAVWDELGTLYRAMGKQMDAEQSYREALSLRQKALSLRHSDTARTTHNLGKLFFEQHKYEDAGASYIQANGVLEEAFGADSPAVADVLIDMAVLAHAQRSFEDAGRKYQAALEIRRKHGVQGSDVRSLRMSLAELYYEQSKWPDAEAVYRPLLTEIKAESGQSQPEYAKLLARIAEICRVTSRWSESEQLYRERLSLRDRAPEGLELLPLLVDLGEVTSAQGKFAEARENYRRALEIAAGAGAPVVRIADVRCKLGQVAFSEGKVAEAATQWKECLDVRQKSLPPFDNDIAGASTGLAQALSAQKNYRSAQEHYLRALSIEERNLGPESDQAAATLLALGMLQRNTGQLPEAHQSLQRVVDLGRKTNPDGNVTLAALISLAGVNLDRAKFAAAESLYASARTIIDRRHGEDSREMIPVLQGLAEINRRKQNLASAESSLRQVLQIAVKTSEQDTFLLASARNGLALVLVLRGKYPEAEEQYRLSINLLEKNSMQESAEAAICKTNLADLYRLMKKYKPSKDLFTEAQELLDRAGPPARMELADLQEKLSKLALETRQTGEAEALCRKALATHEEMLGQRNANSARVLNSLARVQEAKGDFKGARESYTGSIEMYEAVLGPDAPELIPVLEDFASFLRLRKRDAEAASLRDRVRTIRLKTLN